MPITLTVKGTKKDARRELERRNIAAIALTTYTPEGAKADYVQITILDTMENQQKVQQWFGEYGPAPFPAGTLLFFSYGSLGPQVTKVETVEVKS